MVKSDKISVVVVGLRDVPAREPLFCGFDWAAARYETDPDQPDAGATSWLEQFEIWMHPAMEKIIRFEVRSVNGNKPFGKVQIDLGLLKAGSSDAWYQLSRLDGELPYKGQIRIRLNKDEDQKITAAGLSAVLPSLETSVAASVEAEYVATLTKKEREAFYDQKALKPAYRAEREMSSDEMDDIPVPSGKNIAVFWELKNVFPGMEDRKIHSAMAKNDNDLNRTMEYVQKKQHRQAREVMKHEYLDGGRLLALPIRDADQERKNINFLSGAVAGEMMDVPLFESEDGNEGLADAGRRKALLIGCAYQQLGGDWDLQHGPLRDIRRVRNWLENVWGFANEEGRMMMMADDHPQDPCKPTAQNMVRAFEWLGRDAQPGDSLFVYFSGRGGTNPSQESDKTSAFEGERPFWYGIDGAMIDITEIYSKFLIKLPEACRVTFLIDCPNFHLWQPWYFNPTDLTLRSSSHPYFLPSDVQVFSSIAHKISAHGGRFTNTFLSLTSGEHVNSSYYELLHNLNKALGLEAPERLQDLTGTRMNYYTCSQRSDLRRPFDLNTYVPNCNRQIGPGVLNLSPTVLKSQLPPESGDIQFKLTIKATDQPPAPAQKMHINEPGNLGVNPPSPQKSNRSSRKPSSFRENIKGIVQEAKVEYAASRQRAKAHQKNAGPKPSNQ